MKPKLKPCSGYKKRSIIGYINASTQIFVKKKKHALHFPSTNISGAMGVVSRVSKVPSFLSSAKDRIVRKGTSAGAPKNSPIAKEDNGGSIQSVYAKL